MLAIQFALGGLVAIPSQISASGSSGPLVSSYSPSDNATNVPTNASLILAFDENVKKGTGTATIQIHRQVDNIVVDSFVVASDNRVVIGTGTNRNIVTITPTAGKLVVDTNYYITIDAGAFLNDANMNFAGITSAVGWDFKTVSATDTTAPTLSTDPLVTPLTPANGGTAGVGTSLTLVFSEPVFAANGSITVTNHAQAADVQSIPVNALNVTGSGTNTIVVSLPSSLRGTSAYDVVVPNGAFQDASGNRFAGIALGQWQFTTTAPPLGDTVMSPLDNAFAVPVATDLKLTFPGTVVANTGTIRINRISDNSTVQTISVPSGNVTFAANGAGTDVIINPSADLAPNTGFYVLIDAGTFKDTTAPTASLYQGISDATMWNFYTDPGYDVTPPTLLADRKPLTTQASTAISLEMNFSEPVYPGTGNITIRTSPSGTIFASYPVTSSKVSGGGTTKIVVTDSSKTLINNQSYYVEIGGQAFSDARGNYYTGLSGSSGWSFTVTQDSVKPIVVSQSPANTATNVPVLGAKLGLLFNEPILIKNSSAVTVKRITGTGNSPLTTTLSIDPTNNSLLQIAINGTMAGLTDYYVEIAAGAVTDLAGNNFDGILNQYQWTFKTSNSSTGAPTVSKAELVGSSRLAITFNDNLDTSAAATPVPANFYVTVNGSANAVTNVQISGQVVTLTLTGTVSSGQVIKVSYSALGASPIKSLAGIAAASFSNVSVTNVPDSTAPVQVSGTVNANLIILTMSEALADVSPYAYSQFSVTIDGSVRTATQITGSGNMLFLYFSGNPVVLGQKVLLSYYASSYPLKDLSNNALYSFSNFNIQNGQDVKAPALQTITSTGSTIILNYDEALNTALVPPVSSYYVRVNGTVRSVSYVVVSGSQVLLTLASPAAASDTILVTYLGGSPELKDLGGNSAPAFNSVQANAGSTGTLSLNGIIAKGGNITATYGTTLNASYQPSISQFAVKVNAVSRPISAATVSGSSVVLTLYTPVSVGDSVTVSYVSNSLGIRSTAGALAASFTDTNAANQTTWDDNTSGDYTSASGGGLGIKVSAATTSTAVSPAGSAVNQFALTAEKINNAFNTIRKTGGMEPRVVFTVPSAEKAAMVALPLGTLEDVKKATPNASFVVAYQNTTYEIPLSALNYTQLGQMMNAASAVGQLIVSIDTNAGSLAASLTTQLNGAHAQTLVSPISFDLAVSSNGQTKQVDDLSGYVTRTIATSAGLDGKQVAVVWLDPQSGKISYVPTQVTQEGGQSIISFKRKGNSVYAAVKGSVSYTDIAKHWARSDIQLMANKYIVEGNTLTTFGPNKAITRGEFAMFIAKGLGLTGDRSAAAKFKDVNTNTTLATYIGAASKAGIIQGMTDGSFKPNSLVTREEMASMMVRAASAAGVQIVLKQTSANALKKFTDRAKIGTWAQTDVAKAVEAGVITGMSNGAFGGKNNATRAEAAVMVKRLLNYAEFINS